ncbi:MAG: O-antigen polymerase [Sumerlaeia bacterium]
MTTLLLAVLFLSNFSVLAWCFIKRERIYEYPFFLGGIFAVFVLPQALALAQNPEPMSTQAVNRIFVVSILCLLGGFAGYFVYRPKPSTLSRFDSHLHPVRVFHAGILFLVVGLVSFRLMLQSATAGSSSIGNFTGWSTKFHFFSQLVYPALAILIFNAIRKKTLGSYILVLAAAAMPLRSAIKWGRREDMATLALTIGIALFFEKGYKVNRAVALGGLLFVAVAIPFTTIYRQYSRDGRYSEMLQYNPVEIFIEHVNAGEVLELRNAAYYADTALVTNTIAYGTGYWDTMVFRFVPAQFVGAEFKNSLRFKIGREIHPDIKYAIHPGTTKTGMGDTFEQLGYFGFVVFLIIGAIFRFVWSLARERENVAAQVMYVTLVPSAMTSVTHGTMRFFPDFVFLLVFIGIMVLHARTRRVIVIPNSRSRQPQVAAMQPRWNTPQ